MFEENNSIDQLYLRRINSSPNTNNVTLLVLLTVLAVSVCCIACFCVQFFRSIVNRPRPETTEDNPSSLVREGIIANMTPRQRRAVLETFFSDTSNKVNLNIFLCYGVCYFDFYTSLHLFRKIPTRRKKLTHPRRKNLWLID
jgi:hypothetical protein